MSTLPLRNYITGIIDTPNANLTAVNDTADVNDTGNKNITGDNNDTSDNNDTGENNDTGGNNTGNNNNTDDNNNTSDNNDTGDAPITPLSSDLHSSVNVNDRTHQILNQYDSEPI